MRTDEDISGDVESGDAAVLAAARCVREIVTAWVVHKDAEHASRLIGEYLEVHEGALVAAASSFVAYHATRCTTREHAEDRFYYLLTLLGDLIDLAAGMNDVDAGVLVLEVVEGLDAWAEDEAQRRSYRAAQTCLIAHSFVRRGRPAWGIQQSLDEEDMLLLNAALAEILSLVAASFRADARADVFMVLLREMRHLLALQAKAQGLTTEALIEGYFMSLAARDATHLRA